jgi:hypothetical protein
MEDTSSNGTSSYISADEGNKRVQELIDQGMKPKVAVEEVMKRVREETI